MGFVGSGGTSCTKTTRLSLNIQLFEQFVLVEGMQVWMLGIILPVWCLQPTKQHLE